jgi:hypothetical protein
MITFILICRARKDAEELEYFVNSRAIDIKFLDYFISGGYEYRKYQMAMEEDDISFLLVKYPHIEIKMVSNKVDNLITT